MLSVFPDLLTFGIIAPFLLRVTLGIILISIGHKVFFKEKKSFTGYYTANKYPFAGSLPIIFGSLSILVGLFLIIGFLTQVAALLSIYILVSLSFQTSFYALAVAVSVSLLFLGAGIWAVDLPL
jgi:uncharacterized membrane protein YphA (DoxX/SURF4 family)